MKDPYLSVIFITHNKSSYSRIALDSIHKQTLSKEFFEVLVVTDYNDIELEKRIDSYGYVKIYTDKTGFIDKVRLGTIKASGKIITFLEDDDIYSKDRLKVIYDYFSSDDHLSYYHNSHIPIDQTDKELPKSFYFNIIQPVTVEPDEDYENKLLEIANVNPDFNTSSIAIKKSVLLESFNYFEKMSAAVDNFMFYCAATKRAKLMIDSNKLTFYRIHQSQTLIKHNFESFINSKDTRIEGLFNSYLIINEMTLNSPAEDAWNRQFIIYKAQIGIAEAARGKIDKLPTVHEAFNLLTDGLRKKRLYISSLAVWSCFFNISPRFFRYPYYKYKMWELKRISDDFA